MPIDDRFDFFWVGLQSANVDDATAAAGEVVAIAPPGQHIASVDEAAGVKQLPIAGAKVAAGRSCGAHPQDAIGDFEHDRPVGAVE